MRPVFADMVTEVQRSIGFFQSLDRKAKIGKRRDAGQHGEAAGPGAVSGQAPGLRSEGDRFVQQAERGVGGRRRRASRTTCWRFRTCYGLCLQGLGKGKLSHEPAAAGDPHAAADPGEKAVGRGGRGGDDAGLCVELSAFGTSAGRRCTSDKEVEGVKWKTALTQAKSVTDRQRRAGRRRRGQDGQARLAEEDRQGSGRLGGSPRCCGWK